MRHSRHHPHHQHQAPLLPYQVKQLGLNAAHYGTLQSTFSALQLLGGLLSGEGGGCGCKPEPLLPRLLRPVSQHAPSKRTHIRTLYTQQAPWWTAMAAACC
jgi:hypothetical protein